MWADYRMLESQERHALRLAEQVERAQYLSVVGGLAGLAGAENNNPPSVSRPARPARPLSSASLPAPGPALSPPLARPASAASERFCTVRRSASPFRTNRQAMVAKSYII